MEKRVRLEDKEMSGGGKGHKLEDETRVRTDYLSFLAFLEAGQIKVSRVLIWGRRHDAKQIQTVPVYPGLPPHRGIGVLGYWCWGRLGRMKPLAHYGSLPGSLVTERPLPVSHVAETISYIQNQVEHHRLRSF
jgi:hypothetical protein